MEERRSYERVSVGKHANQYDYMIEIGGVYYSAKVMNISAGGAYLRLNNAPAYDAYGMYGKIKDDYYDKPYLKGQTYSVAWQNGYDVGVSFTNPLARDYDSLYAYYGGSA